VAKIKKRRINMELQNANLEIKIILVVVSLGMLVFILALTIK